MTSASEPAAVPAPSVRDGLRAPQFDLPPRSLRAVMRRRLQLAGGQLLLLQLQAGDHISIEDPEGGQACWLGAPQLAALGLGAGVSITPDALRAGFPLAESEIFGAIAATLRDSTTLTCITLPAPQVPGPVFTAQAASDTTVLLGAPGAAMAPDEQTPPTPLWIDITHAGGEAGLTPPPLAVPIQDIRVPAASARAFAVKAGEYIQIIDVDGRQCSDFVAFDATALAAGQEHGIDATATRTLLGSAFAAPGLHAKYFDDRLQPLVEVVRDTVGRHDTFLLACAAKYYDDAGYPGHANCTDNFNAALAEHGIAPRAGWPAINFFYNTSVNPDGSITMDEPWSRPGDYVLLRALTDLVCASSSCSDDIDPANAWVPTDIHVRVYAASNAFSKGIAHRMTPDAPPQMTRETGFHPRTAALTRNFTEYRGFWLPTCFTNEGPVAEYWACRERVIVTDLSPLRKFELLGPDAELLAQLAVTRDVRKLAVGQVVYSAMCYPHGGMLDDCTIFRLGTANWRLVAGDDYVGVWLRELAATNGLDVRVKSSTDQLHNLAVQGPRSREILRELVVTPPHQPTLAELGWFRFTVGKLAGCPVLVSRTGYTGELGYEIWCHPTQAAQIWDAVMAAGVPFGIMPLGLGALDMLRIEAGLVFAGYDFCDQTDPFEAGIGFTCPAAKAEDFVGAEALARRRANPQRKLVGLLIHSNECVGHGDCVHVGRAQIGVVTSATHSPLLKAQVALARVDVAHAEMGTRLEIGKLDGQQKRLPAEVVRFPHYDPDKSRVRA